MEIEGRKEIEARFAGKLGKLSSKHRKELVRLLGNPPDIERVPDEFWQRVEGETEDALKVMLLLIFGANSIQHGSNVDKATREAEVFSDRRAKEIAVGYAAGRKESATLFADEFKDQAQKRAEADVQTKVKADLKAGRLPTTTVAKPKPIPKQDIEDKAVTVFGPKKDEQIAVNETTNASVDGAEAGIRATVGTDPEDVWRTERDARVCPICNPLEGTTRKTWGNKFPTGPPAHVMCRCEILYARPLNNETETN